MSRNLESEAKTREIEAQPEVTDSGDDPEAAAFFIDRSWICDSLDASGRLFQRRGIACLKYDLAAVTVTAPGELFHLPDDGVGLNERVNGPGTASELKRLGGDVRRQWAKDIRLARGGISVTPSADGTGLVTVSGNARTEATDESVPVRAIGA